MKKFLAGFAPVLAVTAFALVPVAAQAAPHYYVNGGRLKAGTASTKTSISWGNLTLRGKDDSCGLGVDGCFTCHYAVAATLFNPEPLATSAGEGLIQQFAPFACEQEHSCPTGTTRYALTAEKLPWHDLLTEEVAGTIRQETTGIKLNFECFEGNALVAELKFVIGPSEKGQRPKIAEGTSALHPGFLEFDTGSGELELEGSLGGVSGHFEGALKLLGYNAQELISVKSP